MQADKISEESQYAKIVGLVRKAQKAKKPNRVLIKLARFSLGAFTVRYS
jgi:cation transport ATPase